MNDHPVQHIDVIGGGLGGLVAAIEASERGIDVDLWETHHELGGRARTTAGYRANFGPHAVYNDGAFWAWLMAHEIRPRVLMPSLRTGFVHDHEFVRTPPLGIRRALRLLFREPTAPSGRSIREWLADRLDSDTHADLACRAFFPFYDSNVGCQDAAVVWEVMRRNRRQPARYIAGGWSVLIATLAERARRNGVSIHTGQRVTLEDLSAGPVVIATELNGAGRLLADDSVTWPSTSISCLDVGIAPETLTRRSLQRASAIDLDNAGFISRYTTKDVSLAPAGGEVIQCTGRRLTEETLDASIDRIRASLEVVYPGLNDGLDWSRRFDGSGRAAPSQAPGTSWRDRPGIDRGEGRFLVGDHVAAPGFLSEVSVVSAVTAIDMIVGAPSRGHSTIGR